MNFVADESVDRDIVIAMRAYGHRVAYVAEMIPGITDEAVLDLANELQAVLIHPIRILVRSYFARAGLLLELFW